MKALSALFLLLLAGFISICAEGQCDPDHPCRSTFPGTNATFAGRNFGAQGGKTFDGPPTTTTAPGPTILVIPQTRMMPPDFGSPPLPAEQPNYKKLLDKQGPQFAEMFSMSSFSVLAYARGGWPLVVDYTQAKESFALLTVAAEGIEPFLYRLRDSNKAGHFQDIIQLPARFGDKPVIAYYFLRALSTNTGEVQPTGFVVLGLGAGDKAVASVGIDKVVFQPGMIRPPQHEKAIYTFHSEFDFPEVEADVMHVGLQHSQIIATRVSQNRVKEGIRRDAEITKDWDGKRGGKPSLGQHVVQVRAWRSAQDGGDWVAAWSPQMVEVQP